MFSTLMLIPADQDFHMVSVVRSSNGQWQANLQYERGANSFRVMHGSTPDEAIAALFAPVPGSVPPPPF